MVAFDAIQTSFSMIAYLPLMVTNSSKRGLSVNVIPACRSGLKNMGCVETNVCEGCVVAITCTLFPIEQYRPIWQLGSLLSMPMYVANPNDDLRMSAPVCTTL